MVHGPWSALVVIVWGVLLGLAVGLMNNYVGREAAAPGGLMLLWSCRERKAAASESGVVGDERDCCEARCREVVMGLLSSWGVVAMVSRRIG